MHLSGCIAHNQVVWDKHMGDLVYIRCYSGSMPNKASLANTTRAKSERPSKILHVLADDYEEVEEANAGSICVLVGLKYTLTGDTLVLSSDKDKACLLGLEVRASTASFQGVFLPITLPILLCGFDNLSATIMPRGMAGALGEQCGTAMQNLAPCMAWNDGLAWNIPFADTAPGLFLHDRGGECCRGKGSAVCPRVFGQRGPFPRGELHSCWLDPRPLSLCPLGAIYVDITELPGAQVREDDESGSLQLGGMGELHLEVVLEKIRRQFKLNVMQGALQVCPMPWASPHTLNPTTKSCTTLHHPALFIILHPAPCTLQPLKSCTLDAFEP